MHVRSELESIFINQFSEWVSCLNDAFSRRIATYCSNFAAAGLIPSANALSMKECSVKYKAAQGAGEAEGVSWSEFRKRNAPLLLRPADPSSQLRNDRGQGKDD